MQTERDQEAARVRQLEGQIVSLKAAHDLAVQRYVSEYQQLDASLRQSRAALLQYQSHLSASQQRLQQAETMVHMMNARSSQQAMQLQHMQRAVSASSLPGRSRRISMGSELSLNECDSGMAGTEPAPPTQAETFVKDVRSNGQALRRILQSLGDAKVECSVSLPQSWDGMGSPYLFHLQRVAQLLTPMLVQAMQSKFGPDNLLLIGGAAWNAYLPTPFNTEDLDFAVRGHSLEKIHELVGNCVMTVLADERNCAAVDCLQLVCNEGVFCFYFFFLLGKRNDSLWLAESAVTVCTFHPGFSCMHASAIGGRKMRMVINSWR